MQAIKIPHSAKVLLPFFVVVVLVTLMMPRRGVFKYTYQRGGTWNYETLVASFDFPILKTADEINGEKQQRSSASFTAYYESRPDVKAATAASIRAKLSDSLALTDEILDFLAPVYEKGILPSEREYSTFLADARENPHTVFVRTGKTSVMTPISELYKLDEVKESLVEHLSASHPEIDVRAILTDAAILPLILPNLAFDLPLTEQKYKEASDPDDVAVTLGTFKTGDVIINEGDVVTGNSERLLNSYREEFDRKLGYEGTPFRLWSGNFLLSLIMSSLLFAFIILISPKTFRINNEYFFVLFLFVLSCAVTFLMTHMRVSFFLMVPYPVFALYLVSFMRKKLVLPAYVTYLLPLLAVSENGMRLFFLFLAAGCVAVVVFSHFNKGWHQFISAMAVFVTMVFVYMAFTVMDGGKDISIDWNDMVYMLLGSLFVVLTYPLVYLFEIVFNLVSDSRLADLSDTNSKLLRQLAQKAPGTFQHCIAVMNMADAVGKDLDADIPLLRTGALYHDIGKMENPSCFIENQIPGVDYHASLSAKESAAGIIRHVSDGVALARKNKLPKVIIRFITTHHGTTATGYFYNRYLNDGGDPAKVGDFFYPGPRPESMEEVILMFCDSIDAASRTLSTFDYDTVSVFVDKIYDGKFKDGQFDGSEITLRELSILKESVKQYVVHLHHGRIAYPERKEQNK